MATSEGGGYCDCGDSEAFLKDPLCSKHKALNVNKTTSKEVLQKFPEEVKARAKELIHEVRTGWKIWKAKNSTSTAFFECFMIQLAE